MSPPARPARPLRRLLAAALATSALVAAAPSPAGPAAAAPPPESVAAAALARLSLSQRVGQLLMVGGSATGAGSATRTAVRTYHAGNVMLTGRSERGVAATARVTASLRALATPAATGGVRLFIATDQEGGAVQVLKGPGFSRIPAALTQGTWAPSDLRTRAATWARQLRTAGVNVNLAPVADTVPSAAFAPYNDPIGYHRREFGFTTGRVSSHAVAFLRGMRDAGVAPSVKHFPGLGRVTANPDVSSGVTDRTTTRHDPYVSPFAAAVDAGAPFVMVSTAIYSRIDARNPAAFSRTVITGMLRGDLGFDRVVISDDLGQARQVAAYTPGARARRFIEAGGDMVLTVAPATVPAMHGALLRAAKADPAFRSKVDRAALRVLTAKARLGLLG